jgi:glycosyltransferase involved in cell wall biosynthesis
MQLSGNETSMDAGTEAELQRLRRRADALRDAGSWLEAAAAYEDFLRLQPRDAGMRVQQAHCLKEAGQIDAALAMYRAAARDLPGDVGLLLEIGRIALLREDATTARAYFDRAVALDPGSAAIWEEWLALVAPQPLHQVPPAAGMLLDLSDLAAWIRTGHRAPSGIQRVQLDLARAALEGAPPLLCAMPAGGDGWRTLPAPLFLRLDHLMGSGSDAQAPEWRQAAELLEHMLHGPPPLRFAPGAVLITLGGTWDLPDYLACLRRARQQDGLRHLPLLHDCVPLLLPEYCEQELVQGYARWFANLALHADGVLTNSRSTRDDMRRLHQAALPGLPVPKAAVVRLDGRPRILATPAPPPQHPLLRGGQPFVLFVSTIEGRKNHIMVFNAWLALLRRLGSQAVPLLVCVGRPGWRAEGALALLDHVPELRAKVRILSGIEDPLLAALYRHCLFTVYNSHHEGWGLPVTESLAAGKVPLVPQHSSLVEAGQGGAVFFPANDEPALQEQLVRLITDTAFRAQAEAAIAAAPPPRSWRAIAAQALAEAARLADLALEAPPPRLRLRNGQLYAVKRIDALQPEEAMAVAETCRAGEGWYPLEDWGTWTRPGPAVLELPLGPEQEGALWVNLELQGGTVPQTVELRALREDADTAGPWWVELAPRQPVSVRLQVPAGGEMLRLEILCAQALGTPDGRPAGIGVTGFALGRQVALSERLDMLERQRMVTAVPVPG